MPIEQMTIGFIIMVLGVIALIYVVLSMSTRSVKASLGIIAWVLIITVALMLTLAQPAASAQMVDSDYQINGESWKIIQTDDPWELRNRWQHIVRDERRYIDKWCFVDKKNREIWVVFLEDLAHMIRVASDHEEFRKEYEHDLGLVQRPPMFEWWE